MRHVSRLLAAQLTNAGLGPGIQEEKRRRQQEEGGNQEATLPSLEEFDKVNLSIYAFDLFFVHILFLILLIYVLYNLYLCFW